MKGTRVSTLWKHLLHRPLEIAGNSFLIHRVYATHALQLTQKAKNTVKYPRVLWMLLPISHLASKSVMIIGLVIRNQSIFLRAELKLQSKVLAQLSRWVGLLIKLKTWDLKIFVNTYGSTTGKFCKASFRQASNTSAPLLAMTLFQQGKWHFLWDSSDLFFPCWEFQNWAKWRKDVFLHFLPSLWLLVANI